MAARQANRACDMIEGNTTTFVENKSKNKANILEPGGSSSSSSSSEPQITPLSTPTPTKKVFHSKSININSREKKRVEQYNSGKVDLVSVCRAKNFSTAELTQSVKRQLDLSDDAVDLPTTHKNKK